MKLTRKILENAVIQVKAQSMLSGSKPKAKVKAKAKPAAAAPAAASKKPKVEPKYKTNPWHKKNPVHHMNIVKHFDAATPEEIHNGKHWYSDAHHFAKVIAKETGHQIHTIAGLTANYSPQTDWHSNMITAARVARHNKPVGGKEQKRYYNYGKSFASEVQRQAADRMLKGEHYDKVISGHKIRHFAHLIEHGGNKDPNKPHVVIDRHAHSVASGARIPEKAFNDAGLKTKKRYHEIVNHYHKAAAHINERNEAKPGDPHYIHAHQVQAVTWLVRQRLNNEEDVRSLKGKTEAKIAKAGKNRELSKEKWKNYAGTWHPQLAKHFVAEQVKKMMKFKKFIKEQEVTPEMRAAGHEKLRQAHDDRAQETVDKIKMKSIIQRKEQPNPQTNTYPDGSRAI